MATRRRRRAVRAVPPAPVAPPTSAAPYRARRQRNGSLVTQREATGPFCPKPAVGYEQMFVSADHPHNAAAVAHPAASDGRMPTAAARRVGCDDMSRENVIAVPRSHDSGDRMSSTIAEIERRIERLEAELARVAPLAIERDRLLRARAALLGEPPPPPIRPPRRVTRDDVASVLARHPGLRAGEIARALGAGQPAISAHLYRGKSTRFESRGGRWFLRASGSDR
jgi:hypothetical protein